MSDSWRSDVQNPVVRWFFVTGNRIAVSVVLVLGFVAVTALSIELGLIHTGAGSNLSTALSSGMLSGLLTLITVALSVNQLILSRLFGSAGALSDQLEGTLEYRRTVEEIADVPISPNEPSAFLGLLGDTLERRVADFQQHVDAPGIVLGEGDDAAAYAAAVTDYADRLSTAPDLDDTFKVLLLTLGTEYADHLDTTRELQAEYGEDLSAEATDAIKDTLELLKAVGTMRQLFKPLIAAVSTGIILLPLAVLVAYLLRVATVSLYTVSVGTFIPPKESI